MHSREEADRIRAQLNPEQTKQAQELLTQMELVQEAQQAADAAPAITITDPDGKEISSLKVKLTPAEAARVLALPEEERGAMAMELLMERRQRNGVRKLVTQMDKNKAKRERKAARKRR